jgi:DNA-binding CsgD family transcriptional regulator
MSLRLKSKLINNLRLVYTNDRYPHITSKEVETYVRSSDLLSDALQLDKTGIIIIDYKTWKYIYCSSNIEQLFGSPVNDLLESGPDLALQKIHQDDLRTQQTIHPMMIDYFRSVPDEYKNRYKFCFTYRYRRADGHNLMILQNNIFIKWDKLGNPIAKLILFTDISDYKKDDRVVFYISRINGEGISEVLLQRSFAGDQSVQMGTRELEIIDLIQRGNSSAEIAEHCELSELTVKNIRKVIMKKLGCRNQAHMVRLASLYGLIQSPVGKAPDVPAR